MVLNKLGEVLKSAKNKIANAVFLDSKLIEEITRELQRALISADVNIHLVKQITDDIKKTASNEKIKGIEKKEQLIKHLHDKIIEIIGQEKQELQLNDKKQTKIMLLGLYGAGKTTLATKLALYYSKRGKKVAVISLDVWRPAAAQQLTQNAKKIKIQSFTNPDEKDPIKIYKDYKKDLEKFDVVIVDTAGRHSLDKELVDEISTMNKEIKPDYKILVIQADIGQAAKTQASEFQKTLKINGVVITRMDSTAKAGGALTACHETKAPVFFIGTGEKPQDLESFNPKSFVNRLLDLGDIETLLEKVETAVDKESSKKLKKKLEQGKFDLRDFQQQIDSMSNMGSFSKMAEMIPGFSKLKTKMPENLMGQQEDKMKKFKHIINSMTQQEIENPELITKQTTRIGRIAKGSGATTTEVRQLIKQYNMIAEMAKNAGDMDESEISPENMMNKKQMMKMAKKFGKKVKF
jgi:signal recognition particle subunit SRP54